MTAFRDDHEAALARIEALEAELARERKDDFDEAVKVERLVRELAAARTKLRETEEELDQHRPRPRPKRSPEQSAPRRTFVALTEPVEMKKPSGMGAGAIAVGVFLIAIVAVGLILIALDVGTPTMRP